MGTVVAGRVDFLRALHQVGHSLSCRRINVDIAVFDVGRIGSVACERLFPIWSQSNSLRGCGSSMCALWCRRARKLHVDWTPFPWNAYELQDVVRSSIWQSRARAERSFRPAKSKSAICVIGIVNVRLQRLWTIVVVERTVGH